MKTYTRRELLRGLAVAPAFAMLEPLAHAGRLAAQYSTSPFQRLNIIFHGFLAIEFASDEVHVYLPPVASDYAYLAGTWMQEVTLAHGGKYRLSGMMTGPRPELETINPAQNAVFKDRSIDPSLAYCELVFPFPDFITPLRLVRKEHGKNFFAGTPRPIIEPSAIPMMIVLTYVHPDSTMPLEFRPLPWTPVIEEGNVNLHIWDAPAKTPTDQEVLQSIARLMKMIRYPGVELNPYYTEIKPPRPDEDEAPMMAGLSCEEEWTLVERLVEPDSCGKRGKYDPKKTPLEGLPLILY